MKTISIIGYHHSGKTTTAISLITLLTQLGYNVSSIKDIHNVDYSADTIGSNSWQHRQSGSRMVFARGLKDTALFFDRPLAFAGMLPHLSGDFLIIEGMRELPVPQILCVTKPSHLNDLISDLTVAIVVYPCLCEDDYLMQIKSHAEIPVFHCPQDAKFLMTRAMGKSIEPLPMVDADCCSECGSTCDELMREIIAGKRKRSECKMDFTDPIRIKVDGRPLPIVPFIQRLFKDQIDAFIRNLKGTENATNIEINLRRQDD